MVKKEPHLPDLRPWDSQEEAASPGGVRLIPLRKVVSILGNNTPFLNHTMSKAEGEKEFVWILEKGTLGS